MSDTEIFDGCIKEVDVFSRKVYNRQSYQWKVTIGLWALIAAAVNFLWGKSVAPPYWIVLVVLVGCAFFWVRAIAVRNHDDQELVWYFIRKSWSILSIPTKRAEFPLRTRLWSREGLFGFMGNWAHAFECITTAAILHVAYWLLKYSYFHTATQK